MRIQHKGINGIVSTFEHDYGLMYRVEWQNDFTIDILQKDNDEWKGWTILKDKEVQRIGHLIDNQLKKAS